MRYIITSIAVAALAAVALVLAPAAVAQPPPTQSTLVTGIEGASGSTIGPDGALYVTESQTGNILRVDTASGATSVFASGLPTAIAPIGGPMDITFDNGTAYVLVSLVGEFFGSDDPSGIYRMDGPNDWTVIADLGTWAIDNPPTGDLEYEITTGVHYAIDRHNGGFVVSEAHHNKVLQVSPSGTIRELEEYGNTVPAGLAADGNRLLIAMSGATPHLPEDGQIVALSNSGSSTLVAAGAPLLVDVEIGQGAVYGLAQGFFTPGQDPGSPAEPNTGELLRSDGQGGFESVASGLNRPTSVELVGSTAYVVGMGGDVVKLDGIGSGTGTSLAVTGTQAHQLAVFGIALVGAGAITLTSVRRYR